MLQPTTETSTPHKRLRLNDENDDDVETIHRYNAHQVAQKDKSLFHMRLGPVYQVQMLSAFLQVHFATSSAIADAGSRRSFLLSLPDEDLSFNPLLKHAVAMVCYGHIGTRFLDNRMIHKARESYGKTLGILARHMRGESQPYTTRTALTAMLLLTMEQDILVSSRCTRNAWQRHYEGAEAYMNTQKRIDFTNPSDRLVFINLRQPAMYIALANRRASNLSLESWVACHKYEPGPEPMGFHKFLLGVRLASLIERTEKCCVSRPPEPVLNALWVDLIDLQKRINGFLRDESSLGIAASNMEQIEVDGSDTGEFDTNIEEHQFMKDTATIPSFFRFHSQINKSNTGLRPYWAGFMIETWMFALILDCTLLRLVQHCPRASRFSHENVVIALDIQQHAHRHAINLCRSLHHLSKSPLQGCIDFLNTLRELVKNFFEETNAKPELIIWCRAIGIETAKRRLRLWGDKPRTLCRMRDLHTDLSNLSRFRAPPMYKECLSK